MYVGSLMLNSVPDNINGHLDEVVSHAVVVFSGREKIGIGPLQ